MDTPQVTPEQFAALDGLDEWRVVVNTLQAEFQAASYPAGAALVAAIADAAEAANHHPDIHLRYPGTVRVVLTTHWAGAVVTNHDVDLARQVSELARQAGAPATPLVSQLVELGIDTLDADRIRPFWAALLGYRDQDGALVDPAGIGPPVWFQQMEEPRTERNRFHLDVSVPHDAAQARLQAALAAGGTLVTDRYARSWWVLADADGNEACICTWQDR